MPHIFVVAGRKRVKPSYADQNGKELRVPSSAEHLMWVITEAEVLNVNARPLEAAFRQLPKELGSYHCGYKIAQWQLPVYHV